MNQYIPWPTDSLEGFVSSGDRMRRSKNPATTPYNHVIYFIINNVEIKIKFSFILRRHIYEAIRRPVILFISLHLYLFIGLNHFSVQCGKVCLLTSWTVLQNTTGCPRWDWIVCHLLETHINNKLHKANVMSCMIRLVEGNIGQIFGKRSFVVFSHTFC